MTKLANEFWVFNLVMDDVAPVSWGALFVCEQIDSPGPRLLSGKNGIMCGHAIP
jgi:hypothetical protein